MQLTTPPSIAFTAPPPSEMRRRARRRNACSGACRSAAGRTRTRAVGAAPGADERGMAGGAARGREFVFEVTFNETGVNSNVLVAKVVRRIDTDGAIFSESAMPGWSWRSKRGRGGLALPCISVGQSVRCAETGAAYGAKRQRQSGRSVHSFKLFSAQRLRRLRRRTAAPGISSRL